LPRRPKLRCLKCEMEFLFRGDSFPDEEGVILLDWGICPHCSEPQQPLVQDPETKQIHCLECKHRFELIPQPSAHRPQTEEERRRKIELEINEHRDFMTRASGILDVFKCPKCGGEMSKDLRHQPCSEGPMMICDDCKFNIRAIGLTKRMSRISPVEREITEFLTEGQERQIAGVYDPESSVVGPRLTEPFPPFETVCRWAFNKPFLKGAKDRPFITKLLQLMDLARELLELCESEEFHCEECPMWYEQCIINLMNTRFSKWKEKDLEEEQTGPG